MVLIAGSARTFSEDSIPNISVHRNLLRCWLRAVTVSSTSFQTAPAVTAAHSPRCPSPLIPAPVR
eukprot:2262706-Pleurochrysis_carterae.AAC.2